MNKYMIKRIIKYGFLFLVLVVLTQTVYNFGKDSYNKYIDSHENDLEWVEKNIVLEDDYKIGSQVKVVHMPENLNVSEEDYKNIISKKIKSFLVNRYSIESPLLIYNPFKEENSLYIYFHTGEKYYAEYYTTTESIAIKGVEELKYQPFLNENGKQVMTSSHYYVIDSLVPKKKNNIIIRILDENGEVIEADNFIVNIPNTKK